MLKLAIYLPIIFFSASVLSQGKAEDYAKYINKEELSKHLHIIASDSFAGRETGYEGQKLAADYLINSFKEDGLKAPEGFNNYSFPFKVLETVYSGELTLNKQNLELDKDFIYLFANKPTFTEGKLYKRSPIEDKVSIVKKDWENKIVLMELKGEIAPSDLMKQYNLLKELNVLSVVFLTDDYQRIYSALDHFVHGSKMTLVDDNIEDNLPMIIVNKDSFSSKKSSMKVDYKLSINSKVLDTENVVAFIEGSDEKLKEEVLILTAHYDHIGAHDGLIYNGADDDGTGTVALLEIAEAFQKAKDDGNGPKRSVLIMPVAGEEKGLLGSYYYAENPIYPLANTITNLNIDMIGRVDEFHTNDPNYVYIIGSNMLSDDLHEANAKANREHVHLNLDYKYNSLDDPNRFYFRSDHYNFAKNNIPSIFYFSGVHEDYHKATDTVDKIDFNKVEKISRLVFHTAWLLLNEENRPLLNE